MCDINKHRKHRLYIPYISQIKHVFEHVITKSLHLLRIMILLYTYVYTYVWKKTLLVTF